MSMHETSTIYKHVDLPPTQKAILLKVGVVSSNLIARSNFPRTFLRFFRHQRNGRLSVLASPYQNTPATPVATREKSGRYDMPVPAPFAGAAS